VDIGSSWQGVTNSAISVNLGNLDNFGNLDGLEAWVHIRTVPFEPVIVVLEALDIDAFGAAYIAVGLTGFAVSW